MAIDNTGREPSPAQLRRGEIALDYDKKIIYGKHPADGSIVKFNGGLDGSAGAGLIGFDGGLTYPSGSLGEAMGEIQTNVSGLGDSINSIQDTLKQLKAVGQVGLITGFHWFVDSSRNAGYSLNDWSTGGTGSFVGLAATSGSSFAENSIFHEFVSGESTYSLAGIRSLDPVVKRGTHAFVGGFVFEACFANKDYVEGSCGFFGLSESSGRAYGNFSGDDQGIGVGWGSSDDATSALTLFTGDGETVTAEPIAGTQLSDEIPYFLRMICEPGSSEVRVTLINMDTGSLILDNHMVVSTLPNAATPMYVLSQVGTLGVSDTVVKCRLWAMSGYPFPSYAQ